MSVRFKAQISGVDKVMMKIEALKRNALAGQIRAVQDATFLVHKTAVESIQENSDGFPMKRYSNGRARNVLVSPPGTPPNTDTGRLVQSIKFDFKDGGLIGRIGTNLRYGAWLEFGTKTMQARPWLSAAVNEVSKEISKIFIKAFRDSARGKK